MKERAIRILFSLLNLSYPIDLDKFANEFSVSTRTIRNDIVEINEFLTRNGFEAIKTIRNKGIVILENENTRFKIRKIINEKVENLYLNPEDRILEILFSISLSDEPVFAYKKENEFKVSKSTIDEDMRQLRRYLGKYDLSVNSDVKKGLSLSGNEHIIRVVTFKMIGENLNYSFFDGLSDNTFYYRILSRYIPIQSWELLSSLYDSTILAKENNLYKINQILFTAISLKRAKKGCLIKEDYISKINSTNEYIDFIKNVLDRFKIKIDNNEISYLIYMLKSLASKRAESPREWIEAQLISLRLFVLIEEKIAINQKVVSSEVHENLQQHIASLLRRIETGAQIPNPLKWEIKTIYPEIFEIIERYFAIELNYSITEDEIAYLTTYFSLFLSPVNDKESFFSVAVLCHYGTATSFLIKDRLEALFNIRVMKVLSIDDANDFDTENIDLIFSTIKLNNIKVPSLTITPIFDANTIERIENFLKLNEHLKRKNDKSNGLFHDVLECLEVNNVKITTEIVDNLESVFKTNGIEVQIKEFKPMIIDVLEDENILIHLKTEGWRDAIEKTAQPLLRKEVITENYKKKMVESVEEYGPYIVIAPHIALAHARPEDGVNQLGLSVATLNQPIEFGNDSNDPVKLIFCLAAVDSYSHLEIMREIVSLINDSDKVQNLVLAKDINEFKKILWG